MCIAPSSLKGGKTGVFVVNIGMITLRNGFIRLIIRDRYAQLSALRGLTAGRIVIF